MKYSKRIQKEADEFFKMIGLEEEIQRLSEVYASEYMISGEETESLQEALHRAPDALIDVMWRAILDETEEKEADRNRREELLYQEIPGYLKEYLVYMDPIKLKLLIRVMNNYPIENMETVTVNEEFIPYGWVFCFIENNSCTFVVPEEIRNIIMMLEQPEIREEMGRIAGVRFMVNTCLGLYGVFEQELFINIYMNLLHQDGETFENETEEYIKDILFVFEQQNLFWRDDKYIVSPYFESIEEYKALLKKQKGKKHYQPTSAVIEAYAWGSFFEKNEAYKAVHQLLSKEIKDLEQAEDMLEEISGHVVRSDWGIKHIMSCLYSWDVTFTNEKAAERIRAALSEWIHGIRRWSECGHSRKELGIENEEPQYAAYTEQSKAVQNKVYPNDPCPCGSGKKYKKCCGRQ